MSKSPDNPRKTPLVPLGGDPVTLTVDPKRLLIGVLVVCASAELLFILLDYVVNYSRFTEIGSIRRLVNATREDSVGSWFSMTQTFVAGMTLWALYFVVRKNGERMQARGWMVLAIFFTYMSLDDGSKLHERVGTASKYFRGGLWEKALELFPSYAWQLVFLPIFGALGLFAVAFLWFTARDRVSRLLVVAGISCFVVAVAMDFQEGLEPDHRWNVYAKVVANNDGLAEYTQTKFKKKPLDAVVHFSKSFEESIEMFGTTLLWILFLRYLMIYTRELSVQFQPREEGLP